MPMKKIRLFLLSAMPLFTRGCACNTVYSVVKILEGNEESVPFTMHGEKPCFTPCFRKIF